MTYKIIKELEIAEYENNQLEALKQASKLNRENTNKLIRFSIRNEQKKT